jgi:hypothetical protein
MVRLHTSLLVVTLASTGSALASSNEYQRRNELDVNNQVQSRGFEQGVLVVPSRHFVFGQNNLQSRGFVDEEDLFVRDLDAFDNLEARREHIGIGSARRARRTFKSRRKIAKHKRARGFRRWRNKLQFITGPGYDPGSGSFEPTSHFSPIGRDLDDLEAREPIGFESAGSEFEFEKKITEDKRARRFLTVLDHDYEQQITGTFHSHGLEDDNEDLSGRDLEAEELFGRGYDLLEERDIIDDLD